MKQVALITNFNIPEKLSAAMRVAERLFGKVEKILIPVTYKERILRSKNHRSEFRYCTQEEIDEFCIALPRYKRPRKIFFDKVPRNPTGKIEKPVLREKYCHGRLVESQITG